MRDHWWSADDQVVILLALSGKLAAVNSTRVALGWVWAGGTKEALANQMMIEVHFPICYLECLDNKIKLLSFEIRLLFVCTSVLLGELKKGKVILRQNIHSVAKIGHAGWQAVASFFVTGGIISRAEDTILVRGAGVY